MRLLIISDLHIGDGSEKDMFGWDEFEFIKMLKYWRPKVDHIILNGDTFELYKFTMEDIINARPRLVSHIYDNCELIKGNHDFLIKAKKKLVIKTKDFSCLIEHGNSIDGREGFVAGQLLDRFLYILLSTITRIPFINDIYIKIYPTIEKSLMSKYYKDSNDLIFLNYAFKKLFKYDIVVLGHTHTQKIIHTKYEGKYKVYVNCGTCSETNFQGVLLDTELRDVRLI